MPTARAKPKAPRHSGLKEQLVRALAILRDLDRMGGIDIYDLADRHGVSTRQVRRIIDAIEASGAPLTQEEGEGRRMNWRVAFKEKTAELTALLDMSHYLALRASMSQAGATKRRSPMFKTLEDLASKIEKAVGMEERDSLRAIDDCFLSHERFGYLKAPREVLWPLIEAIRNKRVCRVIYRAARIDASDNEFELLPLKLFVHDEALYLLCHVLKYPNVTTLNLHRLRQLKVLERTAKVPDFFNLEQWERQAFKLVTNAPQALYKLHFDPEVAIYIREREWHPGQKIKERADGSVELSFTCAETYEVASWVASWRNNVEVLEPASLRQQLAKLGAWMTETYGPAE
ncbi:MAG: WYL domain-containing protein [Pseudomonadota bacterium]